jgi:hypothetical protein
LELSASWMRRKAPTNDADGMIGAFCSPGTHEKAPTNRHAASVGALNPVWH